MSHLPAAASYWVTGLEMLEIRVKDLGFFARSHFTAEEKILLSRQWSSYRRCRHPSSILQYFRIQATVF